MKPTRSPGGRLETIPAKRLSTGVVTRAPCFQNTTEVSRRTPGRAASTAAAATQSRDFTALPLPARRPDDQPARRCQTPGVDDLMHLEKARPAAYPARSP